MAAQSMAEKKATASMGTPDLDTWLARLLHHRGRLDIETLLGLLTQVRSGRAAGTLAETLASRGLVPEAELRTYLAELDAFAETLPTAPPAPSDLSPGQRIEHLVIERKLGAGGMGAIYVALDEQTGARYAVKILPPGATAEDMLRFGREGIAQAAADQHPNVVRIHRSGQVAGHAYLVMDLATGGDLKSRLANGPLPPLDAATLIRDLARGLAHVHANGVLHRDLKPANVVFGDDDVPKLMDFGLARCEGADTLTQTGTILGTPGYMAPEQIDTRYGTVAAAADVYGLGAVLYHCLTGHAPFQGASVYGTLLTVLNERPVPPRNLVPEIPAGLEAICLRSLEKAPATRPASADALATELDEFLAGAPARRSSITWAGVVALAATGAATAWGFQHMGDHDRQPVAPPAPDIIRRDSPSPSGKPPTPAPKAPTEDEVKRRDEEIRRRTEAIEGLRSLLFAKRSQENTEHLQKECEALLKLEPSDPTALAALRGGLTDVLGMHSGEERWQQLLDSANRYAKVMPDLPRLIEYRSKGLKELGHSVEAVKAYDVAIASEQDKARAARLLLDQAIVYRSLGDYPRFFAGVDESMRLFPSGITPRHHRYKGVALGKLRRLREALKSHDRGVALARDTQSSHQLLKCLSDRAVTRSDAGDLAGAIEDLDEALQLTEGGSYSSEARLRWAERRKRLTRRLKAEADSPKEDGAAPDPGDSERH